MVPSPKSLVKLVTFSLLASFALNSKSMVLETHPLPKKHLLRKPLLNQRKKLHLLQQHHQRQHLLQQQHPPLPQLPVHLVPRRLLALQYDSEHEKQTSASTMLPDPAQAVESVMLIWTPTSLEALQEPVELGTFNAVET